jgi:hypothetical protein
VETTTVDSSGLLACMGVYWLFYLVIIVLYIAGMWALFQKAGRPGWAAIVPFYNTWVLMEVAGRPGWWFFLLLIPFVNIVIWIIVCLDVATSFGKGVGFGIGLLLLGFIFYPILGFGGDEYVGPGGRQMV